MKSLVRIISGIIIMVLMDKLWLGMIMDDFYKTELATLLKMEDGNVVPHIPSALIVYILMAVGLEYFIVSRSLRENEKVLSTVVHGILFGVILFGVYEFTNYAVIRDWTVPVIVADVIWGGIICGTTTFLMGLIGSTLNNKNSQKHS